MSKSKRGKRKTDSTHSDRSGGADINAEQVNIGGDVVGRDKISAQDQAVVNTGSGAVATSGGAAAGVGRVEESGGREGHSAQGE
jgi:hypothetical protein